MAHSTPGILQLHRGILSDQLDDRGAVDERKGNSRSDNLEQSETRRALGDAGTNASQ